MKYAITEGVSVVNIALADAPMLPNWINIDGRNPMPGVGWIYDLGSDTFTAPMPQTASPVRDITPIAYLKRFTQAERIAIRAAAASNPAVNDYVQLLNAVTDLVHLDDPDTVAGLNALEAAGIIGAGRSAAIRA